jgi:hypothetical protein
MQPAAMLVKLLWSWRDYPPVSLDVVDGMTSSSMVVGKKKFSSMDGWLDVN